MSKIASPRILVEAIGSVTVARFVDSQIVAEDVVNEVCDQLLDLAAGHGGGEVLLSFGEVRFMSSTVLAVLLKLSRQVAKAGGRLKLCGIDPLLMDVFRITKFDRLFEIHAEEWSALESFESEPTALARA